jgi:hypothetical protein
VPHPEHERAELVHLCTGSIRIELSPEPRGIGVIRVIGDHQSPPGRITPDIRVIIVDFLVRYVVMIIRISLDLFRCEGSISEMRSPCVTYRNGFRAMNIAAKLQV